MAKKLRDSDPRLVVRPIRELYHCKGDDFTIEDLQKAINEQIAKKEGFTRYYFTLSTDYDIGDSVPYPIIWLMGERFETPAEVKNRIELAEMRAAQITQMEKETLAQLKAKYEGRDGKKRSKKGN